MSTATTYPLPIGRRRRRRSSSKLHPVLAVAGLAVLFLVTFLIGLNAGGAPLVWLLIHAGTGTIALIGAAVTHPLAAVITVATVVTAGRLAT
jgi:peptidoglycan/LPS O-acetylase OafA/YrhL